MRRRSIHAAAALLVALLASALLASSAHAHVELRSVTPAERSTVDAPPEQVVLEFSTAMADRVRAIELRSPAGELVVDEWSVDGTRVVVTPPEAMPDGTWRVDWRVVGGDGHPLVGSFWFAVGEPSHGAAHAAATASGGYPHDALELVALAGRALVFAGLVFGAGSLIFAMMSAPGWMPRHLTPMVAAAGIGAWLVLATHVAMHDELTPLQLLDPRRWLAQLGSPAVRGYLLGALLLLVAAALRGRLAPAEWERRSGRPPVALLVLVVLAAAAPSISGHAYDGQWLAVRMPLDALHVLAAAGWLGGLVQLLALARPRRALDPRVQQVVRRYSTIAAGSVGVLVATGTYAVLDELDGSLGDFVGSGWGRLVLVKVVLLALALPLANVNRTRHVPGLATTPRESILGLRRYVAWELAIVAWVIVATAALVYETPPGATPRGHGHMATQHG